MRQVGYLATIKLNNGRTIDLSSFEMSMTYDGLIEGIPTAEYNDAHLIRLAERLARRFGRWPVHVLDPPRKSGELLGSRQVRLEKLPAVVCVGFFDSSPIGSTVDPEFGFSRLAVAWFQHKPEFPIADDARPALAAVDWESLARDGED